MFLADEQERREYVLNEQGVIFRGSSHYISPLNWDFGQVCQKPRTHIRVRNRDIGFECESQPVLLVLLASFLPVQFEDDMVDICLNILDKSLNYGKDPAGDLASRSDPVYVGRVISAMVGLGQVETDGSGPNVLMRCSRTVRSTVRTTEVF